MPLPESLQRIGDEIRSYSEAPNGSPSYSLYVHEPEDELAVRREIADLTAYLTAHGVAVAAISLADLFWDAVDESGFYDEMIDTERANQSDPWALKQVHETLHEILTGEPSLADRVVSAVEDKPEGCAVILYRAGGLYPVFRTSALLDDLRERLKRPVVLVYPGHVVDPYGLRFMGICEATHGYRAKIVKRRFGDFVALDSVSLTVAPGEKVAIMGPSGSGKTTLLRIAMTLEEPSSGSVSIGDLTFDGSISERRNRRMLREVRDLVGMVFQQFNLFENLTAEENIALPLRRVKGATRQEAAEAAADLLERVGLKDQARHYPKQLSGGQAQRVAIARALALEPSILLFDEPTSALDPELVGEVLEVIRDVALGSNASVVIVTHEIGFAAEVADRMVFMDHGKVVEEGPPMKLLKSPARERTRTFLRSVMGGRLE